VNDVVHVVFGNRHLEVKVLDIRDHIRKEEASDMYEVLREYREESTEEE